MKGFLIPFRVIAKIKYKSPGLLYVAVAAENIYRTILSHLENVHLFLHWSLDYAIGSMYSLIGAPDFADYGTAKTAILGLTRATERKL
jgi:hypothetical protein